MNHADASYHIDQLQKLGFRKGLLAEGWMMKDGIWITIFKAGPIMIEAVALQNQPVSSDYAVIYSSWDGQRRRDVSDLSEEKFVEYMLSQPKSVDRPLKLANG